VFGDGGGGGGGWCQALAKLVCLVCVLGRMQPSANGYVCMSLLNIRVFDLLLLRGDCHDVQDLDDVLVVEVAQQLHLAQDALACGGQGGVGRSTHKGVR
jgi:hypothetical protein